MQFRVGSESDGPVRLRSSGGDRPIRTTGPRPPASCDVAFIGPVCAGHGGTEAWHLGLLPRLAARGIRVGGYGVEEIRPGPIVDAIRSAGIGLYHGRDAMRALCAGARLVIAWGDADLGAILPANRPPVLAVSHGDDRNAWTIRAMLGMASYSARYVAISPAALRTIPRDRRSGAVIIPNAVDPTRLEPPADREA